MSSDPHLPENPMVVNLWWIHNQPIIAADALKHRDVSSEVKDRILELFKQGYSPSKGLELRKYDLQVKFGDEYVIKSADRAVFPDLQYCYR